MKPLPQAEFEALAAQLLRDLRESDAVALAGRDSNVRRAVGNLGCCGGGCLDLRVKAAKAAIDQVFEDVILYGAVLPETEACLMEAVKAAVAPREVQGE